MGTSRRRRRPGRYRLGAAGTRGNQRSPLSAANRSRSALDDLPVAVLAQDSIPAELPEIAAPDADRHAVLRGPGEEPLGDAPIARHEVAVLAVVHVRDPLETGGEAAPDCLLPDEPRAPRLGAAREVERAVVDEVLHDRVEVVAVEGVEDRAERLDGHGHRRLRKSADPRPR